MVSFNVETLAPLVSLSLAMLFGGTLFYLARLHGRVAAMRGAQAELRGLLRACSDAVDGAERSVLSLREAAQTMAGDLGRTMDEADRLRAEIDRTCATARQTLERLGPLSVAAPERHETMSAAAMGPTLPPVPTAPPVSAPIATPTPRPASATGNGERAAMRLFRETIRGL